MSRELYIIQGRHLVPEDDGPLEVNNIVDRETELWTSIMEIIASNRKVTHYFSDGITVENAQSWNKSLDLLLGIDEMSARGFLDELIEQKEVGSREIGLLYNLNKGGLRIRSYETDKMGAEGVLAEEAAKRYSGRLRELITDLGAKLCDDTDAFYSIPILSEEACRGRDETVFDNVNRLAGKASILFMGLRHELTDFDYHDHDFTVYRVSFYPQREEKVVVTGELPWSLRESIIKRLKQDKFVKRRPIDWV